MKFCVPAGLLAGVLLTACAANPFSESQEQEGLKARAARINVELASEYIRQGQYEVALDKLKKALYDDPELASARHVIAFLYERLGEVDLARRHYREAIALDPLDPNIRNTYGAFLCNQGENDAASREFDAALKNPLYKTPEVAYTNAAVCVLGAGREVEAEAHLKHALQANPRYPDALYQQSAVSLRRGEALRARAYLQRYEEITAPSAASLALGVRIERALGNTAEARRYADALKNGFSDSDEARQLTGSETHGIRH